MTTGSVTDRSETGATLSASFSGATGAISEVGFYYKLSTASSWTKVQASGTSSPFSKAISGLTAGKTYAFKAYVKEYSQAAGEYVERESAEDSFTTLAVATSTVTTNNPQDIKMSTATLRGSFSGATGAIHDRGFRYRKSGTTAWTEIGLNSTEGTSGSFAANIDGLVENTQYEYQAYVAEYNESTKNIDYRYGDSKTFTTTAAENVGMGYLSCYEVPKVTDIRTGKGTHGTNSGRGDNWFMQFTSNPRRQIATHTFAQPETNKQTRNFTVLYDGDKYAPLWVAYAMHSDTWAKNLSGRDGSWGADPAIFLTQQTGLDNAQSVGYSRGHMVSSQERQTTNNQNDQTFYYTNQAPQWQNSFNNGVWSSLESDIVAHMPSGRDTLYVVTGVLYEGSITTKPSGNLDVPIPSHFYKCLMKCSFNSSGTMTSAKGIAYIYTNAAHSGNYYDSGYVTTIDAIETRSGFDFFANVPTSLQNQAEGTATAIWTY